MSEATKGLIRKLVREIFPEHVHVIDEPDLRTEDAADTFEIRVVDASGDEPIYGVAAFSGKLVLMTGFEAAARYELRHLAKKMGYPEVAA